MPSHRSGPPSLVHRLTSRPPIGHIVVLALVWTFFWGDLTPGNLLAGVVLGWFVTIIFPLPRTAPRGWAVRPTAVAKLVGVFLVDVVVASVQISWAAVRGRHPKGGIIRVQLQSHSDIFLTATAGLISLIPGSVIVDVHRLTGMLYVHVFDIADPDAAEDAHRRTLRQEELVLRAFGTRDELLDAGYVPGASEKLGRVDESEVAA